MLKTISQMYSFNQLRPNHSYMHQWTSTLVQIMSCYLFNSGPLSASILTYCWLDPREQISVTIESKHCKSCHCGFGDNIWCRRSWLTMVQVMVCYLTAPSHYLNQCWLIINLILWHSFQGNVYLNTPDVNHHVAFELFTFEITATSLKGR